MRLGVNGIGTKADLTGHEAKCVWHPVPTGRTRTRAERWLPRGRSDGVLLFTGSIWLLDGTVSATRNAAGAEAAVVRGYSANVDRGNLARLWVLIHPIDCSRAGDAAHGRIKRLPSDRWRLSPPAKSAPSPPSHVFGRSAWHESTSDTGWTTTSSFISTIPAVGVRVACSLLICVMLIPFTYARNP